MRNNYYSILLFLLSTFAIAQEIGETIVNEAEPIKRDAIELIKVTDGEQAVPMTRTLLGAETTSTYPTGSSKEVGITEGQLSVSLTGGATYSIPIAVPPGINGVVPQVGLVYNSQGGNGLAGYGWNISGVSAITRIPRTKFHDGVVGGVNLDTNDRFALDGQRLILKTGTIYGAAGSQYETESFSNLKITAVGVSPLGANYGPVSFRVEYPDGSVAYYGNDNNSRSITTWSITYWENPQGVRISYTYNNANNNLTIASIKYGSIGTITPINEIQFVYVTRSKAEQAYIGGQSVTQNFILDKINVLSSNVGFRNYELGRDATSIGYQRLTTITEKSGDNTKALNPTVFKYDDTVDNLKYNANSPNIALSNISSENSETVSGDFDGDGKMDIIVYQKTGADAYNKYWLFNGINSGTYDIGYFHNIGKFDTILPTSLLHSDGKLDAAQAYTVINSDASGATTFDTYALAGMGPVKQYSKSYTFPKIHINNYACPDYQYGEPQDEILDSPNLKISGDFNGDGITDILVIEKGGVPYTATYCVGGNTEIVNRTTYGGRTFFVDINPNKKTNFVTNIGYISYASTTQIKVGDFNGDGKQDIYVFDSSTIRVYGLDNSNQLILLKELINDSRIDINKPILMGDYNGDGKMDFMIPDSLFSVTWHQYFSTGTDFVTGVVNTSYTYAANTASTTHNYIPTDYDNDGKTDLIEVDSGAGFLNVYVMTMTKTNSPHYSSRTSASISDSSLNRFALPVFLPTNQLLKHNLDIAFLNGNKIHTFTSSKDTQRDKSLIKITTGNGVTESIEYAPLDPRYRSSYGDVYVSTPYRATFPDVDLNVVPNFKVVAVIEKQSASVYKKQVFSYAGATSNMEGLGFLGFRASMRTNWFEDQSQIISTVSKFDPNLRGANVASYTYKGLESPSTAVNTPAPNTPRTSAITIKDTRTTSQTVQATNSIRFLPGARISPTAGSTFVAQITPNYDANGYAETNTTPPYNLISKSLSFYEASLSPTKVYNLKNTQSNTYNILENTSSETVTVYDNFNNPTESISKIRNGGVGEQTTTTTVAYESVSSPYMVGRPASKTQTVTSSGDTMTSKEVYGYGSGTESNLLKTIQKWGNNTSTITENNRYDTFGNITQKTISATGLSPRVTSYKYDITGRFLEKSTDIEGLSTSFAYNTASGTLKSETNPYGLTTSYLYDPWFKKTKTTDYLGKSNTYNYSRVDNINTKVTTTGDDGSYSEEIFDDLGRKITSGVSDISGNISKVSYLYDIYDRNIKVSEPYFGTAATQWNETQYDEYGRTKQNISFTGKTTTITYSGLTTTVNDGSKTKTSIKNAIGNVVSMTDSPGGTINYTYFANGNLKSTNYGGVITTIEQDGWGRKTKLTDPSAGEYRYAYNELGETTSEITPNGTTTYTLDAVGKLTKKTISGTNTNSSTVYAYNGTTKLLESSTFTNTLEAGAVTTTSFGYDSYKRLNSTTEATPYATFTKTIDLFDAFGRVVKETTSGTANGKTSSKTILNTYKNGYAWQILDDLSQRVLWQTNTVNARGQLLTAQLGNGIALTNGYDTYGFASQIKHDKTGSNPGNVMTLNTQFDAKKGNLNWRENSLFGSVREDFTYDSLDRLKTYPDASGTVTQNYYDDGRIKDNTIGTYNYANTAKKYQNTSVTLSTDALAYYKNRGIAALPSPTATRALNISYNTFKSPVEITEDGVDKLSFVYNDNNSRSAMFYGSTHTDKNLRPLRKYYSADGSMEIKHNIQTGTVEFVTYIGGDGYSAPVVYKKTFTAANAQEQMLYLHRDYQGSILAITNEVGSIVEKRLFDAWGSLLSIQNGSSQPIANDQWLLDRGYTGHEHLQSVGLIHMNGRLYDPKLHRFLQPDNYVQDPSNTQNYNRYSYVLNNPLKYTDPSGEAANYPPGYNPYTDCQVCPGEGAGNYFPDGAGNGLIQSIKNFFENKENAEWVSNNLKSGLKDLGRGWDGVKNGLKEVGNWVGGWFKKSSNSSAPAVQVAQQGNFNSNYNAGVGNNLFGQNSGGNNWATATLGFIATDTMIPDPTDVAWPKWVGYGIAGTAAASYLYSGDYVAKMQREIDGIRERALGPPGFVYELRATRSGNYPNLNTGGTTYLNAGDVWKYGQTTTNYRYSEKSLTGKGLVMKPIYYGNQMEILIQEKYYIYGYYFMNGHRPAGNPIFR
jgi:RHS repeat-associated protein